ncbi:MAG TPA: diacylglycerol kinase family protein [Pyrinomonadaceae bacterium]|jgi:YegS/Rv2252/BmrU family lipid kinase
MLPIVIVNPQSAGGATQNVWPGIACELASHFGPFKPLFTSASGHGRDLAADAAQKGARFIIACGGDGTISEVANGILLSGKNVELGILPSGTGGDLRRTLSIPSHTRAAVRILREGQTRTIDVGRVVFSSDKDEHEVRYFLGVASFGMSAAVIERVKQEGSNEWLPTKAPHWLGGRVAFGMSMLKTALRTTPTRVVVQIDDAHEVQLTVTNLCIANARYFGGGMKIAPDAKLTDGKFDVIAVGDLGAFKILRNSPRLYTGTHLSMAEVEHTLAKKVIVRAADPKTEITLEVDGELPGRLPATFQILPAALRVRCPR